MIAASWLLYRARKSENAEGRKAYPVPQIIIRTSIRCSRHWIGLYSACYIGWYVAFFAGVVIGAVIAHIIIEVIVCQRFPYFVEITAILSRIFGTVWYLLCHIGYRMFWI